MNIPTHVAAGMLVLTLTLVGEQRVKTALPTQAPPHLIFAGLSVLFSLLSHLAIDAVPHYDVLYRILSFASLPAIPRLTWVFFKVMAMSVPIFYLAWPAIISHPWMAGATVLASIYPDLEKGLYLNLPFPRWLVIFRTHSTAYSSDGGEQYAAIALCIEAGVLLLAMAGTFWCVRQHLSQAR